MTAEKNRYHVHFVVKKLIAQLTLGNSLQHIHAQYFKLGREVAL